MGQTLDSNDMQFHMLVAGGTGSGKTNSILYMLELLFEKEYGDAVAKQCSISAPKRDGKRSFA